MGFNQDTSNRLFAAVIACCFVSIVLLNLLHPTPSGPPDNGDFNRIFSRFSVGPVGHQFWPDLSDQEQYKRRFFNYYHRFWLLGAEHKSFTQYSSSHFVYLPGRILALATNVYDLAWNSLLVVLLAGWVLYEALKRLRDESSVWSVSLLAFIFADANIVGYINSFFQESGALLYFSLLFLALHLFWMEQAPKTLVAVVGAGLLLAATKTAHAPSVALVGLPMLAASWVLHGDDLRLRRYLLFGILIIFAGSICFMISFSKTSGNERRANCYHFIFDGVLPHVSKADATSFLNRLGLDSSLVRLTGKSAYATDSGLETEPLKSTLTEGLHIKALVIFVKNHPRALYDLARHGFNNAGIYPHLLYPSEQTSSHLKSRFQWDYWSKLHNRYLRGTALYFLTLSIGLIVLIFFLLDKGLNNVLPYLLLSTGLFFGSVTQVLISIFGNGAVDLIKHNYFANLLLDSAFVSALSGLFYIALEKRRTMTLRTM